MKHADIEMNRKGRPCGFSLQIHEYVTGRKEVQEI